MTQHQTISRLLASGLADWVSLHDVVWLSSRGAIDPGTKRAVLDVLEFLYTEGLMVPGNPGASGFDDWQSPPADWVIRSEAELDQLDWRPMGAGFWLRLTEKGESIARSLAAEGDAEGD